MSRKGPVVIIDNDKEDQELLKLALQNLKITNRMIFFDDGTEALEYLKTTTDNPFLILSDLKMPRMDGIELRRAINESAVLKKKSIPFIFISELADLDDVNAAYELSVQGFFTKPNSIEELQRNLQMIVQYWDNCVEPNRIL